MPTIVEPRGAWIRVPCENLHIFQWDILL
jgi:hypothetical protein